ncbi:MAG TPA: DUF6770 family protein, partial [Mucilaginibacter sp.]|nr:DUF6770 family protein [Mucilaginibacter sp.]
MKSKFLFFVLILFSFKGLAQDASKVFDGVKNITVRNVGVIKKNNTLQGYFNFYQFDKVDRKTLLFRLNLLDASLNNLGTKDIEGPKDWELVGSGFDGNNFCFRFWDEKKKTFESKVYDQQANEISSSNIKVNYNPSGGDYKKYRSMVLPETNIVENNGFVDYVFNDPNNAFIVTYINGNTKTSWQKTYEPEGKSKIMMPAYLNGNDEMVLTG